MPKRGKWGKICAAAAGVFAACSVLTCVPAVYPALLFLVLVLIPVVCTLGTIFLFYDGYWDSVSSTLSGSAQATEIVQKFWIWPEIAAVALCIAAIALFCRDKTEKHPAGIALCVLFAIVSAIAAVVRLF